MELHAENAAFETIVFDAGEVAILGKVVEVRAGHRRRRRHGRLTGERRRPAPRVSTRGRRR